jgi:hypothetical protein
LIQDNDSKFNTKMDRFQAKLIRLLNEYP